MDLGMWAYQMQVSQRVVYGELYGVPQPRQRVRAWVVVMTVLGL